MQGCYWNLSRYCPDLGCRRWSSWKVPRAMSKYTCTGRGCWYTHSRMYVVLAEPLLGMWECGCRVHNSAWKRVLSSVGLMSLGKLFQCRWHSVSMQWWLWSKAQKSSVFCQQSSGCRSVGFEEQCRVQAAGRRGARQDRCHAL